MVQQRLADRDLIDADADRAHRACVAQVPHRAVAAVEKRAQMRLMRSAMSHVPQIMRQQQIDTIAPDAPTALLEGSADRIGGIIEDRLERVGVDEAVAFALRPGGRQQAADLGRQQGGAGRIALRQHRAQAAFGEAKAIMRRRIEIADARVPGRLQRGARLRVRHCPIEIADRRCAHAKAGERHHRRHVRANR